MATEDIALNQPHNEDNMFEHIHEDFYVPDKKNPDGSIYISRAFFKNTILKNKEISADWDQKTIPACNPKYTQNHSKDPQKNGVISQKVKKIKFKEDIYIEFEPSDKSKAHCNIKFSDNLLENRKSINQIANHIQKISKWEIIFSISNS